MDLVILEDGRPKGRSFIRNVLNCHSCEIKRGRHNIVTPPIGRVLLRELERQKDQDRANSQTAIQTGRSNVVVVTPPATVLVLDNLVEDVAHDTPCRVVDRGSRRDHARTTKDKGHVDVAERRFREHACEQVEERWTQSAGNEEIHQTVVELTRTEDTRWADKTPDYRGVEEDAPAGTAVVVYLIPGADVFDGAEGPIEDGDLDDGGPDGSHHLPGEEHARRDFHVVAHFEIRGEGKSLGHGNVAVRLEQHHGEGPAGLHVADDELGDDVEAELHVGNGLDHADGDGEDSGDYEGDDQRPPG